MKEKKRNRQSVREKNTKRERKRLGEKRGERRERKRQTDQCQTLVQERQIQTGTKHTQKQTLECYVHTLIEKNDSPSSANNTVQPFFESERTKTLSEVCFDFANHPFHV
jgi:hypothetical protein